MDIKILAALLYGLLALVGGIAAYSKVKSKASLISGAISGIILLLGAFLQFQGVAWGFYLSLIVTIALLVVFSLRLVKTRKFMPSGLMLIAGLVTLAMMLVPSV
ncbi:hypothetical protein C7H19_20690 [Aphanothece hegewaldii CCALA 016]|uniref:Small integral membrane protein n=1 Tax=Aphanothece hegewaldii CCALA 016 TaxID=2107694 RepID=A0A2T1LT26_9CHRO|nr:TMEM14 family protein [Aphanothece hegewaldii]PSF33114.1 hypothetical protein C7H19_20690 [Aphanothece hegewaldii CCALA 016]